jgi:transposase
VYDVQDWAEVRRLHRDGWTKRAIAERLAMSRNTVSALIAREDPPRYERAAAGSMLDEHAEAIAAMLDEDPKVPATVILERLRPLGYRGGITILKERVARMRPSFLAARSYQRTTYLPGELAHLDWWHTGGSARVRTGRRSGWWRRAALGCARVCLLLRPHDRRLLRRAGGLSVPTRRGARGRGDGQRAFHRRLAPARHVRLVDPVAALFGQLSLRAVVLRPRFLEGTGQGERTIGYLETSFLPLRHFEDLEDLQTQHDRWAAEVAFERHHRRVGAKVAVAWRIERDFLHALPRPLPEVDRHLEVRVSKDGFVRVGRVDYSLPPGTGGRRVSVRLSLHEVRVHLEGDEIARHARSYVPADVVLAPAHVRALRLARQARAQLAAGDVAVPGVDLARYDAIVGAAR